MNAAPSAVPHASTPVTQVRLARALLQCAVDAFLRVPAPDRQPALQALDHFLATPDPAAFLAAVRVLREVKQASALRQARMSRAEQDFVRGLDLVRREISTEVADALSALPVFEEAAPVAGAAPSSAANAARRASGAGSRLRALALLAAAHQELADRVAGRADTLRQHLARAKDARPQPGEKPPARRRTSGTRAVRQSTVTSTKK